MAQFRRGKEAVAAAATSGGGGKFSPFVPDIRWKEDGDKKYILILTPADGVAVLDLHEFIPLPSNRDDGKPNYESFLSRKDPMIGENYDLIEDEHGRKAKTRCAGVAVELVPVMKDVKGRKRPASFAVTTSTFTRKGDDGEEEVEKPNFGLIVQSSKLMWGPLNGLDESAGPLIELPIEITRRGEKAETTYEMVPFMDIPVDLSAVTEYIEGISYLKDDIDTLLPEMEEAEDDTAAAQLAASFLLNKRVDELADPDRYERLLDGVDYIEPNSWEKGKKKTTAKSAGRRTARPSQRKARAEVETAEEEPDASVQAEADAEASEDIAEEAPPKSDRFAKLKARVEQK
jgi:hypothetical protein